MDTHSPRAHTYAVGRPREIASRRRRHIYLDEIADNSLSTLRRLLPGASDSRIYRAALDALVDRLQPSDIAELEAELTGGLNHGAR